MKRVNVSMSDELFERVEAARVREPRSPFVARMLESALSEAKGPLRGERAAPGPVGSDETVAPSSEEPARAAAPTRAPETDARLVPATGVRSEHDGAMVPPSPVVVPSGSSPEPPPTITPEPDPAPRFELPKIAPRKWGR